MPIKYFAQGHITASPMRFKPATSWSRVPGYDKKDTEGGFMLDGAKENTTLSLYVFKDISFHNFSLTARQTWNKNNNIYFKTFQ